MSKHSNDQVDCPSCLEKLEQAHPLLGVHFKAIRFKFLDLHISETYRDKAAQEEAFRVGRSTKRFPNSKHNVMVDGKPQSRAFDFFKQENGKTRYPPTWIYQVVLFCKEQKMPFRFGYDFPDLDDTIHIELVGSIV